MKKLLTAVILTATASTSAFAWGPHEQGIVTGIAGLWAYQQLSRAGQPQPVYVQPQPQVIVQQPPVVIQQPQVAQPPTQLPGPVYTQQVCETRPVQDYYGVWRYGTFCYYR